MTLAFGLTIAGGLLGGILSAIAAVAAGCCPLEIAVAAGIGAVSGLVGTAAGLAFKNPAVAGAVGGAVADVVAQAFNGQAFDPVSAALSAGIGGFLGPLGKLRGPKPSLSTPRKLEQFLPKPRPYPKGHQFNAHRQNKQGVYSGAAGFGAKYLLDKHGAGN